MLWQAYFRLHFEPLALVSEGWRLSERKKRKQNETNVFVPGFFGLMLSKECGVFLLAVMVVMALMVLS